MRVRGSAQEGEEFVRPRGSRPPGAAGLLGLPAAAGNRAVAAALAPDQTVSSRTVSSRTPVQTVPVQRCGDHVSPGCPCAEEAPVQREDSKPDADTHEPHRLEGTSCTPYTRWQAPLAFARMKAQLLPAVLAVTGSSTNVQIWNRYLGDGGTMAYSDTANPGDPLVESVRKHEDQVPNAVNGILDHIERQLTSLAPQHLRGRDSAELDVATLVPPAMLKPQLEWVAAANPAANVIGQVGSSDVYGRDKRSISGTVRLIKQHRPGDRLTVDVRAEVTLKVHVEDTCDFCPGNIGPVWEQNFTIPLSRLEASGWAHDVHVVVDITEANRSTGLVNVRDPDVEG